MKALGRILLVIIVCYGVNACSKEGIVIIEEVPITDPSTVYMAVFGDIQYYTNSSCIDMYQHSLNWLSTKVNEGWFFNCILHTGDVTMSNDVTQWNCFFQATSPIAQHIPFISMIGDHDYTWEDGIHIEDRYSTLFNRFLKFPLTKEKVVAWFEDGRMENVVVENTIFGERLDLLVLEFGPRREVVEWADAYVKAHSKERFILMTHEYLENGGGRRTTGLKSVIRLHNTNYTTPEELWNKLIKCNDNIRVVLCGHVGSIYALTVEENDFGREIPQIQHNIQGADYRYDNWLMLWEFPMESDSVNVFIYNTKTEQYYNNQRSLFKFSYREDVATE